MSKITVFSILSLLFFSCRPQPQPATSRQRQALAQHTLFDTSKKTIHVFVALCDNKHQGIIPVPASIGNGQDPNSNLYWGCDEGVRTYFKKSTEWSLVKRYRLDSIRLERLIFRHKTKNFYLVADAYDGRFIRQCTIDFLRSCAGQLKDTLHLQGTVLGIDGNARLTAYIGHDGLMDFRLANDFQNADSIKRDAIILACISKKYFAPFLRSAGARPLVWTTGLMCPEAYTLHDAVRGYINGEPTETIRGFAAKAYDRNQRCGAKAAMNLLVTGW
jgi:hypothetical protein